MNKLCNSRRNNELSIRRNELSVLLKNHQENDGDNYDNDDEDDDDDEDEENRDDEEEEEYDALRT